jgi:prolyl-tRNA editing enzyme YbaK/EbsC (Cys-tRNA(Pro) deacylase)
VTAADASHDALHPSAQRVADALAAAGVAGIVHEFTVPTRTSQEAAEALGCTLAAIASCLVFYADDEPIVVIKSGIHRVDVDLVAATLGAGAVRQAKADEVRAVTGQPIGGVAPVNWPTSPRVFIDETLVQHDPLWSAAGTPNAVFPTSFEELVAITGASPISITQDTTGGGLR